MFIDCFYSPIVVGQVGTTADDWYVVDCFCVAPLYRIPRRDFCENLLEAFSALGTNIQKAEML